MNIAIIGMSGVFPGSKNIDEFWENICGGKDTVTRNGDPVQCDGYMKINAYGSIDGMYNFDPGFFGMTERDAIETDPQERFMMMLAYHALEDAGIVPNEENNRIGLVCGAKENEYALRRYYQTELSGVERETAKMYLGASLATRTAYKLNLQGPVLQIRATCATGLAAAHLASGFLNSGEADVMLAGAVNLSPQHGYYAYMDGGITSADGYGRAFSEEASGCIPGDGAAVVVLKRYEDAVRDHDQIYAVIRGSALRNDVSIKMGFSAPSRTAEMNTILDALHDAEIQPEQVDHIETHGTATRLGDMVELGALQRIFKPEQKLMLGAVKNNIGHLNYAAGIAGLIKTSLMLRYKKVPPVVNVQHICKAAEEHGFVLSKECVSLTDKHPERPLTAGVSSFGIGGNNVHMVLQSADVIEDVPAKQNKMLFFISAFTHESLSEYEKIFSQWIKENPEQWQNAAYTLCVGRRFMPCRSVLMAENINGCISVKRYEPANPEEQADKFTLNDYSSDELEKAAGTFLAGENIGANPLTDSSTLHKISLPKYCFADRVYNFFADDDTADNESEQNVTIHTDTLSPKEVVTEVIKEVTGNSFSMEDDIDSAGLDSLTFVIVCSKFEARYGVNCSSIDLFEYDTMGDLVKDITDFVSAAKSAEISKQYSPKKEQTIEDLLNMIS